MNPAMMLASNVRPAATPVVAGTPLVQTFTSGAWAKEPTDQPGQYDSYATLTAGALPGTKGPVVNPGPATLEQAVAAAADRARGARAPGGGVFPAQVVLHDAKAGYQLVSLNGGTRHGAGTVGAIDGWAYQPDAVRRLHPDVRALVGGERWADFSQGDSAKFQPLPTS